MFPGWRIGIACPLDQHEELLVRLFFVLLFLCARGLKLAIPQRSKWTDWPVECTWRLSNRVHDEHRISAVWDFHCFVDIKLALAQRLPLLSSNSWASFYCMDPVSRQLHIFLPSRMATILSEKQVTVCGLVGRGHPPWIWKRSLVSCLVIVPYHYSPRENCQAYGEFDVGVQGCTALWGVCCHVTVCSQDAMNKSYE